MGSGNRSGKVVITAQARSESGGRRDIRPNGFPPFGERDFSAWPEEQMIEMKARFPSICARGASTPMMAPATEKETKK
ncbi:hypothetical protein TNIN_325151 [Trichonephila inaurata madagascariensis]|uniref:Uncharacterized protein n=1 Tax=Trichonephila inaurata madagascariensis TaxID=2747483 RepID=A0A8X7C3R4_9ARAC|nr:hypothetical protein TNIN_325151 [Trichonephila inaurata madagascariensis]